jgi:hypothetical protein
MDPTAIGLIIFNGLLGLVIYLLKQEHTTLKIDSKDLWIECKLIRKELDIVKDKYFKKEDFTEFKKELWARLDRMEDDFTRQIQEMRK